MPRYFVLHHESRLFSDEYDLGRLPKVVSIIEVLDDSTAREIVNSVSVENATKIVEALNSRG